MDETNWKPIKTATRTPGERVLLIDEFDEWPYIGIWMEEWGGEGLWLEDDDQSMPDHQPDHWMPLPGPPPYPKP